MRLPLLATAAAIAIAATGLAGCGSKKHAAAAAHGTAHVGGHVAPNSIGWRRSGALDGMLAVATPTPRTGSGLGLRSPYPMPDRVLAIGSGNEVVSGTIDSGGNFAIDLRPGHPYFLGFYHGTTFLFCYGYTTGSTPLHTLPMNEIAAGSTVDLGDMTAPLNGTGVIEAPSDPTTTLSLSTAQATIVSRYDQLLSRFQNIDVDGDGTFDMDQGHYYNFYINYQYTYASGKASAAAGMLDPGSYTGTGYMFYAPIYRADLPGDADLTDGGASSRGGPVAKIALPGNPAISMYNPMGGSTAAQALGDNEDGYQRYDNNGGGQPAGWFYNFYCGGNIVGPADAPAGDYLVTVCPFIRTAQLASGTDSTLDSTKSAPVVGATPNWATTYTFKGLPAISFGTVTSAPKVVIHVNVTADTITSIDYAWMIFDSGAWRAMTVAEVVAYSGGSDRGPGIELAAAPNGSMRYELNVAGGVASGSVTAADLQGGGSFPLWSAVDYLHLSWEDFTGTDFGVDLR